MYDNALRPQASDPYGDPKGCYSTSPCLAAFVCVPIQKRYSRQRPQSPAEKQGVVWRSKPLAPDFLTNNMAASTPKVVKSEMVVNVGSRSRVLTGSAASACVQSQTSWESGRNLPHISYVCI
jgi:hypothetical protein